MPALPMPEEEMPMMGEGEMPMMEEESEEEESSEEFRELLMKRIAGLSSEEKQQLDEVITPEIADILSRVLPELSDIIERVAGGSMEEGEPAAGLMGGGALAMLDAPPAVEEEDEAAYEKLA